MRTTNSLIVGLCKIKKFEDALHILHYVAIMGYPIAYAIYNTLNGGLCKVVQVEKSHILHKELLDQGHRPSHTISSILIDGFLRANNIEVASEIANEITKNGFTLVAANLNALINAMCKFDRVEHARKYLVEMKIPYIVSISHSLGVSSWLGMVYEAINQLEKIISKGLTHICYVVSTHQSFLKI